MQAKGNAALALMLTVVGNLVGIFTVPFILKGMLGGSSVSLDAVTLLVKLLITILAPLLVGKAVREVFSKVPPFVKAHKTALSLISNGSLILIVWQTISSAQVCAGRHTCTWHGMLLSMVHHTHGIPCACAAGATGQLDACALLLTFRTATAVLASRFTGALPALAVRYKL